MDCPRTLWPRPWDWAEGWASVQWCSCWAECTPWPTCTSGLSSYTMTPSLRLGWGWASVQWCPCWAECKVHPDSPVLVDCPRTLWHCPWGLAEGWASVQWCSCWAECTPWPTCTSWLSSYTMIPSLRLGWRVSVCTVVSLLSWMYSLTHLY